MMAVCACSTGLFQLLPKAAAVSTSSSSQLRLDRGVQSRDVQGAVSSSLVKCVCNSGCGANKIILVHSSSLEKSGKLSSLKRGKGRGCDTRKGYKNSNSLDRKPTVEVQARVQDYVEHETYDDENGLKDKRRGGRDRNQRQNSGVERRRRVQVVTNNGFVDLEEQLGLTKRTKEGSLRLRLSSQRNGNKVQKDEEGRLYFEYEFSGADSDENSELDGGSSFYSAEELQSRQEGDAPTLAQAASLLEIGSFLASERERGQGPMEELPARTVEFDLKERLSAEQNDSEAEAWIDVDLQTPKFLLDSPGGQRVAELVGAWDGLAGRLPPGFGSSSGSPLLLAALKLTVSTLQDSAPTEDGRNPLSRALSVAYVLADLRMDAEVIAAGLLREVVEGGYIKIGAVEEALGKGVGRLLHDCLRVKHMPSRLETLDDDSAKAVRQFCLAFHDVRAVVVEVAARLDTMRHIQTLPRYRQQILALETMQIYAPLAHAMGTGTMSLELEDLGFWVLFPDSYAYIGSWLKRHWADGDKLLNECRDQLQSALEGDPELQSLVESVSITGRCKSRYSTMKKLLRDGRQPEEVFDVLGLRVVLASKEGGGVDQEKGRGVRACYRAMEIATSLWREVPGRLKDYIAEPKRNGYESLHLAVSLDDRRIFSPPMELQIRTASMNAMAEGGLASHSLYKGGLTDPEQAGYLKAIMLAAADVATSRYADLGSNTVTMIEERELVTNSRDHIFTLFDKNQDGVITMDEFKEVIGELGADGDDAHELMKLVDSNFDGSVSVEEFEVFRRQVKIFENLAGVDRQFATQLDQKLLTGGIGSEEGSSNGNASISIMERPRTSQADNPESKSKSPSESSSAGGMAGNGYAALKRRLVEVAESEELVQQELQTDILNKEVDSLTIARSVNGSPFIGSLESEVVDLVSSRKELEKQMWIDRVKDSEKGSTSSSSGSASNSRSGVQSLAKPAKLSRPSRETAKEKVLSVLEVSGEATSLQRHILQPSIVKKEDGDIETVLETCRDRDSRDSDVRVELAKVRKQIASGKVVVARSSLQKLSKKYPGNADVSVHFAQLERKGGDAVAAGAYYEIAIEAFREQGVNSLNYVRALQAWGSLEAQARNSTRARSLFLESIRIAGKEEKNGVDELKGAAVYGLHAWAMLEQKLGNWSKAQELLERAANIQPGNAVVHQSRALLEARAHNYAAARYHFRRAVDSAAEDVKCWQAWALFEASQGKPGKMRQLFEKALEVEPQNLHSLQAWAHQESLLGTGASRNRARQLYQRCVEVNPESVHSWQAWAILEKEAGNLTGARILFQRGLGANSHSIPCLQAYAHMERLCGNFEAAKRLLLVALSVESDNPATLMEIALVEEALGNENEAADYFQMAGIADKQKSRVKRKMFESRKATSNFKPAKSKKNQTNKGSTETGKGCPSKGHVTTKPKAAWRQNPSSNEDHI